MPNINGLVKGDEDFINSDSIKIKQIFLLPNGSNPTVKITSDAMIRLLNRITTLENYINALTQTYEIKDKVTGEVLTLPNFAPQ
jgi:hypothetical protein